jgi:hypothetical protein
MDRYEVDWRQPSGEGATEPLKWSGKQRHFESFLPKFKQDDLTTKNSRLVGQQISSN